MRPVPRPARCAGHGLTDLQATGIVRMPYVRIAPGERKVVGDRLIINPGKRPILIWIGPVERSCDEAQRQVDHAGRDLGTPINTVDHRMPDL